MNPAYKRVPKPYNDLDKVLNAVVHRIQFILKEANQISNKPMADRCIVQLKAIEAFRKAFQV